MNLAKIDLSRINANYSLLSRRNILFAVLKSDAYGHGMIPVAETLWESGCRYFAVTDGGDAWLLKKRFPDAEVLLLSFPEAYFLEPLLTAGVIFPVGEDAAAERLRRLSGGKGGKRPRVHLVLNVGMNRQGLSLAPDAIAASLDQARLWIGSGHLSVEGAFAHLSVSPAEAEGQEQIRRFSVAAAYLQEAEPSLLFHLAATPGLSVPFSFPGFVPNRLACRAGLSLYGYGYPGVHPAMSVTASVLATGRLTKGEKVGYDGQYLATHRQMTATVGIGYAEGLPREGSGAFFLRASGERLPILGRISMNQTVIGCGSVPLSLEDPVTVLDKEGQIMPALCKAGNRIPYELLLMGSRLKRIYFK